MASWEGWHLFQRLVFQGLAQVPVLCSWASFLQCYCDIHRGNKQTFLQGNEGKIGNTVRKTIVEYCFKS